MTTLTLFTFLVFFSSFIVSFFLPDLDPSTLSAKKPQEAEPTSSSSIFEWTFGYSSFQTPWSVAGDMIRLAVETFADVEQAWDDKDSSSATTSDSQGAQEDARDGTRTGAFKSTVRKSTKPKDSTSRRPPKKPSWIVWFIRRYVIGTAFIGSISFLNMFAFGPLPLFRGRLGRGGGRREGANDTITALVIIFLVIGVGRALYKVYQLTEVLAQKLLIKAETAILEVGGDDEDEEEDSNTGGPAQRTDHHPPESSSGHSEDWQQVESEPGSEEGSSSPALRQRRPPPLRDVSEPSPEPTPLGSDNQWEVPPSPGGWSW